MLICFCCFCQISQAIWQSISARALAFEDRLSLHHSASRLVLGRRRRAFLGSSHEFPWLMKKSAMSNTFILLMLSKPSINQISDKKKKLEIGDHYLLPYDIFTYFPHCNPFCHITPPFPVDSHPFSCKKVTTIGEFIHYFWLRCRDIGFVSSNVESRCSCGSKWCAASTVLGSAIGYWAVQSWVCLKWGSTFTWLSNDEER